MLRYACVSTPLPFHSISHPCQVVSSFDSDAVHYFTTLSPQPHRQEIIASMEDLARQCIENYATKRGRIVRRIIMYRDGIGESSMDNVLLYELTAIKTAWRGLYPSEREDLRVTQVVVSQRHHVRLFPRREDGDRSGNVPSGTLIDHGITSATDVDFFLVSHGGLKGVSRPTYYTILCEENALQLAQLEKLTFDLCHVYARCSRAVSRPAPTFYAHLAAYRARYYIQAVDGRFLFAPLHRTLQSTMFYG